MTRPAVLALALATAAASAFAQRPAPAAPSRAALWIGVTATDDRGRPVTDLRPDEFEVWIANFRVPIEDVVAVTPDDPSGRILVVVLDTLSQHPALGERVREAARALVERAQPGDRMAVVPLDDPALELTGDRQRLLQQVTAYRMRGFPFRLEEAGERVLRTVTAVARGLSEVSDRRKAIVGIGAGWLFDTPLPPPQMRDLRREWVDAMRALATARTAVYVIDPAGVVPAPGGYIGGTSGFARETGGHAFVTTNDMDAAAERIWAEMGSYYLLGVPNPPVQQAADLRELEVKVLRRGVNVRARKGIPGKR
jgi:VWFA-related protein